MMIVSINLAALNLYSKTGDANSASPVDKRSIEVSTSPEPKPIERAIEARAPDDASGSMVRCLYLAKTYIVNGN